MNERAAAEALYDAERNGVKQIKGQARDAMGGRCAIGVLEDAGCWWVAGPDICPLCGRDSNARGGSGLCTIAHLNDDHGLTFAEIARKLGPDDV